MPDVDVEIEASEDVLRGIPPSDIEADSEPIPLYTAPRSATARVMPVRYKVLPEGEPQEQGTQYSVRDEETNQTFFAGKVLKYKSRRGLSRSSTLLIYDRFDAERQIGAWAHFMWPTVMAESNGRYISINAWDRAHFTWGFYQLAAISRRKLDSVNA